MKTKQVYLAALLFLYLNVPVHAQSEAIAFDGLQNSLNEFVDAALLLYRELGRAGKTHQVSSHDRSSLRCW